MTTAKDTSAAVNFPGDAFDAAGAIIAARAAQAGWGGMAVRERLAVVRALRRLIAEDAAALVAACAHLPDRRPDQTIVAEILPLAAACRFLERRAAAILRPRTFGGWRPVWLGGTRFTVQRDPFGVVLILSPFNYPLLLPGVQAVQALAAGNAVLLKPGLGGKPAADELARLCTRAGVPENVLTVLPEAVEPAEVTIALGVDKVFLTGSAATGRAVLGQCAGRVTPAVMELSGEDPVVVLAGADVKMVNAALAFGCELNAGHTCIAPRRLVVHESVVELVGSRLPVKTFRTERELLSLAGAGRYGLGASVFGPAAEAVRVAKLLKAGVVTVNDLIVPTADPRVAFGGRGLSGFGKTRGAEGLLECTVSKTVAVRGPGRRRHFEPLAETDAAMFEGALRGLYAGGVGAKMRGWRDCVKAASKRSANGRSGVKNESAERGKSE